ncbi:hypothetical protein CRG98_009686 [Punica granatum]|nr:hypothetical protein CRG98_009686 [Punica granatum]
MEMASLWRTMSKPTQIPPTNGTIWKTLTKPTEVHALNNGTNGSSRRPQKLRKCSSLRVATSFTRVCLCAPISSYNEVFRAENVPPRRSNSYPRSKSIPGPAQQERGLTGPTSPRPSVELLGGGGVGGRRIIFRGKSLRDDVLMRRFVVEEEAMMQIRRRNQMEVIRRRSLVRRRKKLGPSPLSRMVMANDHDDEEDDDKSI